MIPNERIIMHNQYTLNIAPTMFHEKTFSIIYDPKTIIDSASPILYL